MMKKRRKRSTRPARDLGVVDVHPPTAAGQPVERRRAGVGDDYGKAPEDEARVGIGDRAGDPQGADGQLPDEVVDEVLSERAATKSHDEEARPADLQHQIAGDEQPSASGECIADRRGHQQAREHEPDEQRLDWPLVGVEPVRAPGRHVPRIDDRERHDQRLGTGPQVDVLEQVMRQLPDREDVDEIEEQLERADDALSAGRP
jgi:hypothetical protein